MAKSYTNVQRLYGVGAVKGSAGKVSLPRKPGKKQVSTSMYLQKKGR